MKFEVESECIEHYLLQLDVPFFALSIELSICLLNLKQDWSIKIYHRSNSKP